MGEVLPKPKLGQHVLGCSLFFLSHHLTSSDQNNPHGVRTDNNTHTGPGYYNLDRMLATGSEVPITSSHNLYKKPIGSFDPYRKAMSKSTFARTKSNFNVK